MAAPCDDPDFDTRVDMTHLASYAIDDSSTKEIDDAVSVDGDRIW